MAASAERMTNPQRRRNHSTRGAGRARMVRSLSAGAARLRKREAGATIRPAFAKEVATDEARLRELLESVREGALSIDETLERLRHLPYESIGFAEGDHHRALRHGFPEGG